MKKCVFALVVASLPLVVFAQETIPLFEDIPAYEQSEKQVQSKTQTTPKDVASAKPVKESQVGSMPGSLIVGKSVSEKNARRPRLGRDAEPLTSLVIAPFPNTTIDIDNSSKPQKEMQDKKFEEQGIAESELIKRETPLNMTESGKEHPLTKKMLAEKMKARSLMRHDVSKFTLVGLRFGYDTETVFEELSELGYSLQRVEKSIPLFRTTVYDEICRKKKGLSIVSDIRKCILDYAESDETHYVFRETYNRALSRETVQVYYSTPQTGNVVYKIVYQNLGDHSLNSSRKNMAKKMQRQKDFWDLMFETYGLPDENDKILWGDSETVYMKALMQGSAYDAYVVMEDRLIQDKDFEAAQKEFATLRRPTKFTLTGEIPAEDDADSE